MVGLYKLHAEAAQVYGLSVLYHLSLCALHHVVLFQLVLDERDGQLCAVNGHVDLPQHIGQGPDVVLVAVGDHKALDLVDVVL